MTSPDNTVNGPGGRHYTHPDHPGRLYMGVTTAISGGVPKQLGNWFKKITATYAVEHRHIWEQLSRDAAVDLISREADRVRDAAGDRGTLVHTLVEAACKIEPVFEDFDRYRAHCLRDNSPWLAGIEGYVDAGLRFLWDWRPTVHWSETTVYSHRFGYAGTFDLIATVPTLGRLVLDWKTSTDIYAETGLQLAAYRFADVALVDGIEVPVPDLDGGAAIHLRPDGTYAVVPLACGPDQHRLFLHALEVARFTGEGWKHVKQPPMVGVPTERPWWAAPAKRQWLIDRIRHVKEHTPAGLERLAAHWPPGVPTFKQAAHHTDGQLAAITDALNTVETQLGVPFFDLDPTTRPVEVEKASIDDCRALAERIATLPADLRDTVDAAIHHAALPALLSGRLTVDDLASLKQVVAPCEVEAGQRKTVLLERLGDLARDLDLVSAVAHRAANGRHSRFYALSDVELERALLLTDAIHAGLVTCIWREYGVEFAIPPSAEIWLMKSHGGKGGLLDAGRAAARALGLPAPKSSGDVVAEPLLVARLAADLEAAA